MSSLTTVAAVKSYLGITTSNLDGLLTTLIARASDSIRKWTRRAFPYEAHTNERLNGTGTSRITLPAQPVLTVTVLQIQGVTVAVSPDGIQTGYLADDVSLTLVGDRFPMGYKNVVCSWVAGYAGEETAWVPAGNFPVLNPTEGGTAALNRQVSYTANAVVLSEVASAPAAGQYSFAAGQYSFAAADANQSVLMSYYCVPAAVEQACIEMVGLKLKQRDNLGIRSKSLANESITFEDKDMTPAVKSSLQPYRTVTPA